MQPTGVGHPHIDARSLAMAKIIVKRIDEDPTLIEIAHQRLAREEKRRGTLSPARREWKQILTRPWAEIRAILLDESDEAQRLRSSHPIKGIVTEEERLAIIGEHPPPWPSNPYIPSLVSEETVTRPSSILTSPVSGSGKGTSTCTDTSMEGRLGAPRTSRFR